MKITSKWKNIRLCYPTLCENVYVDLYKQKNVLNKWSETCKPKSTIDTLQMRLFTKAVWQIEKKGTGNTSQKKKKFKCVENFIFNTLMKKWVWKWLSLEQGTFKILV